MKSFDTTALAALPNDLRRQVLEAFDEADAAKASGNTERIEKATAALHALTKQVQDHAAGRDTLKAFRGVKGVSGTDNVMRKFAERAGVK